MYVMSILVDAPPPYTQYISYLTNNWIGYEMSLRPEHWGWVVILIPWCRNNLSNWLDTRHGIDTEACMLDNVFPPDHPCFGSDTEDDLFCYMS